jgi:hypothetical protein
MAGMILALMLLAAQTTPVAPPAKGTALPPPTAEEGTVLATVDRLLAAMAARDATRVLAEVDPAGRTVVAANGAVRRGTLATLAAGPDDGAADMRVGAPAVEIDGDIAMVWTGYVRRVGGAARGCGTEHVALAREGGRWTITGLSRTQRADDCPAA